MSSPTGHWTITAQAVKTLASACASHPLAGNLATASLPMSVVARDVLDFPFGHLGDFGQSHHFMRRFDGQSPKVAYEENVEWVRYNTLKAARQLSGRITWYLRGKRGAGVAPQAAKKNRCNLPAMSPGADPSAGR